MAGCFYVKQRHDWQSKSHERFGCLIKEEIQSSQIIRNLKNVAQHLKMIYLTFVFYVHNIMLVQ